MSEHRIVLDRRALGARGTAINFATALGPVSAGETVVVDGTGTVSLAQGFLDELVKQILVDRPADLMTVIAVTPTALHYLNESAGRRGVLDRLIVHAA